jgi:hypothetical protein
MAFCPLVDQSSAGLFAGYGTLALAGHTWSAKKALQPDNHYSPFSDYW